MNTIIERYDKIKLNISKVNTPKKPNIIAVSKTFSLEHIRPLIDYGHIHFGENKVQEAEKKWSDTLSKNKNIELHMVGPIQSNKIKPAIEIFSAIQSRRESTVAISPIVGGLALKGPADRLMRELGHEPSVVGVARLYKDFAGTLVIDNADESHRTAIEALGMRCVVTDTVMSSPTISASLASTVLNVE